MNHEAPMTRSATFLLALLAVASAAPAAAQPTAATPHTEAVEPPPKGAPMGPSTGPLAGPQVARFAFAPVDGGVLKLDTQTGQASYCSKEAGRFACVPVPDARDAYEAEIARLQKEVARLKAGTAPPEPGAATGPDDQTLSEIDQALGYLEYIYKRLRDMVQGTEPPGQKL